MKGVFLEDLTWKEAKQAFGTLGAVAVPVGANLKEHGPHLPLNTDFLLAEHWAREVCRRFPIIVAPTLGWGYYPAFKDFPGTVTLESSTFLHLVRDIGRSFLRHGVRKLLFLNTGVSTTAPLLLAIRELDAEFKDCKLGLMNFVELGRRQIQSELEQDSGHHADEMETSLILAVDQDAVDMTKAVRDYWLEPGDRLIRSPSAWPRIHPQTGEEASGVFGDATLASVEKGKRLWALIFESLSPIKDFLDAE